MKVPWCRRARYRRWSGLDTSARLRGARSAVALRHTLWQAAPAMPRSRIDAGSMSPDAAMVFDA